MIAGKLRAAGLAAAAALVVLVWPAQAADKPDVSTVVASRGGVDLTLGELDAKVRSMPADAQSEYMADPGRMTRVIDQMLLVKQIAAEAERNRLDADPAFIADLELKRRELLVEAQLAAHMATYKSPDPESLAREKYLASPETYRPKPHIDFRHILISAEEMGEAKAAELAESIMERLRGGEEFGALVAEYMPTEPGRGDPSMILNPDISRLDARFVEGASRLKAVGDIVGPIRSRFGYHVIRLERYDTFDIPPFEELKEQIIQTVKAEIYSTEQSRYYSSFTKLPTELNNEALGTLTERYRQLHEPSGGQ